MNNKETTHHLEAVWFESKDQTVVSNIKIYLDGILIETIAYPK